MFDVSVFMLRVNFLNRTINPPIWQRGLGWSAARSLGLWCRRLQRHLSRVSMAGREAGTGGKGQRATGVQRVRECVKSSGDACVFSWCSEENKQADFRWAALLFVLWAVELPPTCQEPIIVFPPPALSEPSAYPTLLVLR